MCFLLNERDAHGFYNGDKLWGSEENSSKAPFLSNYSSTLAASAQIIYIYIYIYT
jgi:hypothetical protein